MRSENRNYLVTGINSGLGKYLHENISDSLGLTRFNKQETLEEAKLKKGLIILHSAFNRERDIEDYYKYLEDNISLTEELLTLPHVKFIYFSSVDIYKDFTPYSFTKMMAESVVYERAKDYLVLRLSALLGNTTRKNSLLKILEGNATLTLSSESSFNYVLQSDILDLLKQETIDKKSGIYDFISSTSVTLGEVARYYNKDVSFGEFKYETKTGDNCGVSNLNPNGHRTSLETIEEFLNEK